MSTIALLVPGAINSPTHWFSPLLKALKELPYEIRPYHPRLVQSWELENHDYVISSGLLDQAANHPRTLVLDLGYFNRWTVDNPEGTFQLGLNKLNWLPPNSVDNERPVCRLVNHRVIKTKPLLVCGQVPGDKQHGLNARALNHWLGQVMANIKRENPDQSIWYRNHPQNPQKWRPKGLNRIADNGGLMDYLPMCSGLVTYNSTAALYALQRGIPVYCNNKAFYSSLCGDAENITAGVPSDPPITRFFERLGYAEWSKAELSTAEVWQEYLNILDTGKVPKAWLPKPKEPELIVTQQEFDLVCQVYNQKNFPKARKMIKQLWHDIIFRNRKDIDEHCKRITLAYKRQKASGPGE